MGEAIIPRRGFSNFHTLPKGTTAFFPFDFDMIDVVNGLSWNTLAGSPAITSGGRWGGKTLYLNGSSAITIPYNSLLDMTSLSTIELWLQSISEPTQTTSIYGNPIRSGTYKTGFDLVSTGRSDLNYYGLPYGNGSSEVRFESTNLGTKASANQWHHLSLNRNNNSVKLYVDGVLNGSITLNNYRPGTTDFLIGKSRDVSYYRTCYIQDLIIVQNNVLRTSNFVPPTQKYNY